MKRESGVLLSVTSLPSKYGIGCFSKSAYDFVDWLEEAGQTYWQILPLGATSHGGAYDSPYQAYSAFAGNPYFISLEALIEEGVLTEEECDAIDFGTDEGTVDYEKMHQLRIPLLRRAFQRSDVAADPGYLRFVDENGWWLEDYALFMAVKDHFDGQGWTQWPEEIRLHKESALVEYREKLAEDITFHKYMQYKFTQQWTALKAYANERHIRIVGDIPIYVSPDGSDVWAQPELFQLDEENAMAQVAGCPPDDFNDEGQFWGNPLYRWDRHAATGFDWWLSRLWYSLRLYDVVRIDHFRGLDEYYAIPADKTAKDGHWEQGPGQAFIRTIHERLGQCNIIVEDLGFMTDSVRELVAMSGYPNMKVLQFAFDPNDIGSANEHLPHNCGINCVMYTGTHDNDPIAGWYENQNEATIQRARRCLGQEHTPDSEMPKAVVRGAMMSPARICVIQIQDYLGLGCESRVNTPGTVGINWSWRLLPGQATSELAEEVRELTLLAGRANWDALNSRRYRLEQEEAAAKEAAHE